MKFFYKMFLEMTVILAVALGMIEYVTLSYSLEHAVKREQDSALSQHQMIKYSIETVILNMKSEDVDKELTDMMSQSAKSIVGDEGGMYLAADDGKRIYANSCNYEQKDIKVKDGTLTYSIVSKENAKDTGEKQSSRYIHVKSRVAYHADGVDADKLDTKEGGKEERDRNIESPRIGRR